MRCTGRPLGREEDSMVAIGVKGTTASSISREGSTHVREIPCFEDMAATERHSRRRRAEHARLQSARATPAPATTPGAIIEFAHVTKRYDGGTVALDDVSFSVVPGEFLFLVGQSGSGKSTTM